MRTSSLYCALALILSFFLSTASAQNRVSGSLTDLEGNPLAAANVLLLTAADSSLVLSQLSSDNGGFQFNGLETGRYLLGFYLVGFFKSYSQPFDLGAGASEVALGTLVMQENQTQLDEVSVVARRPFLEQKIDRMVVNVANSITNAGGNALEVLQRSPGVQVNRLTKAISLLGKEGVIIMINGKISRMPPDAVVQMLEGMNANNIDRIELIHTPPSNFDAEGTAGIINIVLLRSTNDGLNGGYSLNAGHGKGAKYGASGYFNYRKNKLNWYGNYEYNYNLNPQIFTNYRGVYTNGDFLETNSDSRRPHTPTSTQNARLGLDWQASPKTVVGILGTFYDRNWFMKAENEVSYSRNGVVENRILMPNDEVNHAQSFAVNANLSHQISSKQTLNVDADLVQYHISNPSHYEILQYQPNETLLSLYKLRIEKETPIRMAVAKADYTAQLNNKMNLEAGAKMTLIRFDNDVRVDSLPGQQNDWLVIPALSSLFHLNEEVAAAYGSFSWKLDAKSDLKAGLRYEYTQTNLGSETQPNVVDRQYGSWFPSLFLTRNLPSNQQLQLSYSRRIQRPQITQLAPWLIFSDPSTLLTGNPALQPSFTDAFQLNYNIKSWRMGVSYSIETEAMRLLPRVNPETNRQENTFANLGTERMLSGNLYIPFRPKKWWDSQHTLFVISTNNDFTVEGQSVLLKTLVFGFNATHTFTLPAAFSLEISGNYLSPGIWGVTHWRATGALNIGLQKDFGERWGKLRLNATDLLLSSNWYGTTDQPDLNLLVSSSFQVAERTVMLTWTNTFGNTKIKTARDRQTGAADEMRRL